MLRRRYSVENDPEINGTYDAKIKAAREQAKNLLVQSFSPSEKENLEKLGNLDEFAQKNPKGWDKLVEAIREVNPVRARIIEDKVIAAISANDERKLALESAASESSEWFEKRQKQWQEQTLAQQKQADELRNKAIEHYNRVTSLPDFKLDPEEGLEGESLKRVQEANKHKKTARGVIDFAFNAQTIDDSVQVAVVAAKSVQLSAELSAARAKIKALESKLAARAESGRMSKQGRAVGDTQQAAKVGKSSDFLKNIDEIFEKGHL